MRRLLVALVVVLMGAMPFGAQAGPAPEDLCIGVEILIYGRPTVVVPEQCVPCSYRMCGSMLDRCPTLICSESSRPATVRIRS